MMGRGCDCTPAIRQLSPGSSASIVDTPMRMAEWRDRKKCVMALDSGPERRVRTPGAKDSEESSDVANVRVTKMRHGVVVAAAAAGGGRWGSSIAAEDGAKVSSSAMFSINNPKREQ